MRVVKSIRILHRLQKGHVMAIAGVLARVETEHKAAICAALELLDGVTTFDVEPKEEEDGSQVGVLVEGENINDIHGKVMGQVRQTEGVLCAWPVYMDFESDPCSIELADGEMLENSEVSAACDCDCQ